MSSQNLPYVLEIAGMTLMADDKGQSTDSLRETAAKNGVDSDQLDRAITILRRLPAEGRTEFVYQQMLLDGRVKGYVGLDDQPSPWTLGQLAHGYYDLGSHADAGGPQKSSEAQ